MAKGQIKVWTSYGRSGFGSDVSAENYLCCMKIPVRTKVLKLPISMLNDESYYAYFVS